MDDKWKSYPPKTYQKETESLVHLTLKPSTPTQVLWESAGRMQPWIYLYLFAHARPGSGLSFPLDYAEGGAKQGRNRQADQSVSCRFARCRWRDRRGKKAIVAGVNAANPATIPVRSMWIIAYGRCLFPKMRRAAM